MVSGPASTYSSSVGCPICGQGTIYRGFIPAPWGHLLPIFPLLSPH